MRRLSFRSRSIPLIAEPSGFAVFASMALVLLLLMAFGMR